MKTIITTLVAAASLSALAAPAFASGLVPGSDYYIEQRADQAAQSVIEGRAQDNRTVGATVTYGYPAGAQRELLVPGSNFYVEQRADARANAVINGDFNGELSQSDRGVAPFASGAASVGSNERRNTLVPTSDSF